MLNHLTFHEILAFKFLYSTKERERMKEGEKRTERERKKVQRRMDDRKEGKHMKE